MLSLVLFAEDFWILLNDTVNKKTRWD